MSIQILHHTPPALHRRWNIRINTNTSHIIKVVLLIVGAGLVPGVAVRFISLFGVIG